MKDMKVAILGAGLAGLSCAFELKRNGIIPTIFEKRGQIGHPLGFTGICLRLCSRSIMDPVLYYKKKYDLNIKPLSHINEIVMFSQNKKTIARGNLGYSFKRGEEKYSLENQIASAVNLPVAFDSDVSVKDIKNGFDHIVISTGTCNIAKDLNVWTDTLNAHSRIATVLGNFKTNTVTIWFNTKYAKNAFCYLIANNPKDATLALLINDITWHELDFYWKEFLYNEKLSYTITETRDQECCCGFAYPFHAGSLYLTGNSAGLTDDLLGLGTFNAIESGMLAAFSIGKNLDYNQLIKPMAKEIKMLHEIRKFINTFDNDDFDRLLSFLNLPLVKQSIYNNPFLKTKHGAFLAKLYNNMGKNRSR